MTLDKYFSEPHSSIEQYTKQRQITLAKSLDNRKAVYLDQNFWIKLSECNIKPRDPLDVQLRFEMERLVSADIIFCPISESSFMELMKQSDFESRRRTAKLIDRLSGGVALIAFDQRASTELSHFIHSNISGKNALHPLRHLVWTKLAFSLGYLFPSIGSIDSKTNLALQKFFVDRMWAMNLTEIVEAIGNKEIPQALLFEDLAITLTGGARAHAHEVRSFRQVYDAELRGAADTFGDVALEIIGDIAVKEGFSSPPKGSKQWSENRATWTNLLHLALKKEKAKLALPSIHVHASLHAAFRWDKNRNFKGNDIFDFAHASAALAFCDALFTEKALRATITANNVALDKLYDCHIASESAAALAYLRTLPSTTAQEN